MNFIIKILKHIILLLRANNELKQGVGKWYFTYAINNIYYLIINSECFLIN